MNLATTLRLPEKQLKALKVISVIENQSMNAIIQRLIEEYLEGFYDLQEAKERVSEESVPWKTVKKELGL